MALEANSFGPEFPAMTAEYFQTSFNQREKALQDSLRILYVQSEDDRETILPLVQRRYEVCRNVAFFADIPTPTYLMSEAEQVLGLTVEQ